MTKTLDHAGRYVKCNVAIFLHNKTEWYLLPDYVTLTLRISFCSVNIASMITDRKLASDLQVILNISLIKRQLVTWSIFFIMLAALLSAIRAFDEAHRELNIAKDTLPFFIILLSITISLWMHELFTKFITYIGDV